MIEHAHSATRCDYCGTSVEESIDVDYMRYNKGLIELCIPCANQMAKEIMIVHLGGEV